MVTRISLKSSIFTRGLALAIVTACTVPVIGCGANSVSMSSLTGNTVATGTGVLHVSGRAFGGRQPITGATVTLWEAGDTGYGSAATSVATTTTDLTGDFNFPSNAPYTCPGSGSEQLYLTAAGGVTVTGGSPNPAAMLLAGLGTCSTVLAQNPIVTIDEVTTAATMIAYAHFFNPTTESFGTTSTNLNVGVINQGYLLGNLVNNSTGLAVASTTVSGSGNLSGASVLMTPDASKINTIANILAACINSNNTTVSPSTECSTLFNDVNSTPATDTLQAAYYMATNPTDTVTGTSNIAAVYNIAAATGPFQTPLPYASTPNDWTIGVTYSSVSNSGSGTPYILNKPEYIAIDSTGNVWIVNYGYSSTTPAYGSLTELSPTGTPLKNVLNTGQIVYPEGIVIDPSNNVYVSDYEQRPASTTEFNNQVVEYTSSGGTNAFTIGNGPGPMVSDASGDIFVIESSHTVNSVVGGSALEEISSTGTVSTIGALTSGDEAGIVMDQYYNIWVGQGAAAPSKITPFIYSAGSWTLGTPVSNTCTNGTNTEGGAAVDSTGNIWLGNYSAAGSFCEVPASSSGTVSGTSSAITGGGLSDLNNVAVDGASNLWFANESSTQPESVSEFTNSGVALSPSTGFQADTAFEDFDEPSQVAIDPSGNVWVGNELPVADNGTTYGFVTEIIGAAVPVVTPIAAGLPSTAGGTMRIGTTP